jgi:hypothetical protein
MNLLVLAGIVIGVAAASIGVLWVARGRRWSKDFADEFGEHDRAFEFLGTAYAVLLAFVVIQAYDNYNDAKSGAETEAEAVLQLSRTATAFDRESHASLQGLLVCYGRAVIHYGWPAMREKQDGSPIVNDWGTRFREATLQVEPRSLVQRESYRQLLVEQDRRIEGRRSRLAEAIREVPPPMWFVLVLGATLTIAWVILSSGRQGSFRVQSAVVASVAMMVTAALLLVWFLDHPFADEAGSITPIEMEHTLETIAEEEDQAVEVSPPCDEAGNP